MSIWEEHALVLGFTASAELSPKSLQVHAEVRAMCAADRCHAYGRNWTCPPECGSLEQCALQMRQYPHGILIQTTGALEDSFDYDGMMKLEQEHLARFHRLAREVREVFPNALCLGSGGCRICSRCAYPEPCRFPKQAYSSMEGYGLLVMEVCREAGLKYYYGTNTLTYSGCILYGNTESPPAA